MAHFTHHPQVEPVNMTLNLRMLNKLIILRQPFQQKKLLSGDYFFGRVCHSHTTKRLDQLINYYSLHLEITIIQPANPETKM